MKERKAAIPGLVAAETFGIDITGPASAGSDQRENRGYAGSEKGKKRRKQR